MRLPGLPVMASQYTHPDHMQFVADMEAAGLEAEHYRGALRLGGVGGAG